MSLHLELFWSFRSPYSYLATPRLRALEREHDVDIAVRPVLPLALRVDGFFQTVNPLWPSSRAEPRFVPSAFARGLDALHVEFTPERA